MSLKAGRVGVNPADVDPIDGHINPSSLEGYTKQEADAKFETQEAAALLQPKTLEVPIHMLNGSVLSVEEGFSGLVDALTNKELTDNIMNILKGDIGSLLLTAKHGTTPGYDINIDTYDNANGYLFSWYSTGTNGTSPTGMGNTFMIMGLSRVLSAGHVQYGFQMAIGFGASKIALRVNSYNASGVAWSDWKYIDFS